MEGRTREAARSFQGGKGEAITKSYDLDTHRREHEESWEGHLIFAILDCTEAEKRDKATTLGKGDDKQGVEEQRE